MDVSNIVYSIIGIVVAVIVICLILIPTVDGLELENTTYKTLLSVTCTLAILVPIMLAVRMITNRD